MQKKELSPLAQLIKSKYADKKVLYLPIKQVYFDAIMQGRKVQEFREVRPTNYKRYCQLDEEGYEKEDEYGNALPIEYDAIHFVVGYNPDRDEALVEVKDAYIEVFVDNDDKIITYEYGGETWFAEQVVFNLGKILETDLHSK